MKVWVTKYWLSNGIMEADVPTAEVGKTIYPMLTKADGYHFMPSVGPNDWFLTLGLAHERCRSECVKRIASLRTQIAKLEAMGF